jgi:protoporphyrinogen/coproporphyrinogen III oxidase
VSARSNPWKVAVIGGGIAGLSATHRLRELAAARELPLTVALLERGAHLGGPLHTVRRDGFTIETGADSFLTEKPAVAELAKRLGLGAELIPTRAEFRRTFVVRAGRLVEIPDGFSLLGPARLGPLLASPLFTTAAKLRIALEPWIPRRTSDSDESLADFVTRRLGSEVLTRVAQPLAGGIYTADPARLSMRATLPRFVEMERRYGSVVRGLRAAERARAETSRGTSGARWTLFLSLRGGMGALIDALAARLKDSIQSGADVMGIARGDSVWHIRLDGGGTIDADAVICAAPAFAAARMLRGADAALAERLASIRYASAATVNFTLREDDFPEPPRSFGFVVPIAERRKIIAGSFTSLKFEGRAPAGSVLVRAFLGGVLQNAMMELSDDEMIAAARDEFAALLGVTGAPSLAIVQRWPDSMPQYEVGHLSRVDEIEARAAKLPHIALAGAAYRGVGIPDCIMSGERAAETIFNALAAA